MTHDDSGVGDRRVHAGRPVGQWLEEYRPRLESIVRTRMDPRLRRRVDASDVVQETYVEVLDRLDAFLDDPKVDLFVWVRFLTLQKLAQTHRRHLGTAARDARREAGRADHSHTSLTLSRAILSRGPSPSEVAVGAELRGALLDGLEELREEDRELLLLRHFEGLTNRELAQVLEVTERAASMRHVRALRALGKVLDRLDLSRHEFLG